MNKTKKQKNGSAPQGHHRRTPVLQRSRSLPLCIPMLSTLLLCLSCSRLCSLSLCLSFSWLFHPPHPRPAHICVPRRCACPSRDCSHPRRPRPARSCLLCCHSHRRCAHCARSRPLCSLSSWSSWSLWLCLSLEWWHEGVGWCAKGWWWWWW